MLAGFSKAHRVLKSGAGFGSLLALPPLIAAPCTNRGNGHNTNGNQQNAVAVPQLFELFAAYFFVNFLEYIGHEL